MLRRLAAATVLGLMLAGALLPAAAPPPHPALARGLALMREGDFEAAVLELDAAARRIESDPAAGSHRAWAYVYLGVAYLELEQEAVARGKFREALARDPALELLPAEFSAQSIRAFEAVRAEAAAVTKAPVPSPAASRPAPSPGVSGTPSREKKGSKGPLIAILGGGVAAAGAAVALGGGGDGGGGTTSTTPGTVPSTTTTTSSTTVPTAPTTTVPPPTTTPPSCRYDIGGQVTVPLTGCIGCTCSVSASPSSCSWNARTSDGNMITITQGSGTGNGNVVFNVSPSIAPRTGRITLAEGGGTCTVSQVLVLAPAGRQGARDPLSGGAAPRLVFTSARR